LPRRCQPRPLIIRPSRQITTELGLCWLSSLAWSQFSAMQVPARRCWSTGSQPPALSMKLAAPSGPVPSVVPAGILEIKNPEVPSSPDSSVCAIASRSSTITPSRSGPSAMATAVSYPSRILSEGQSAYAPLRPVAVQAFRQASASPAALSLTACRRESASVRSASAED